MFFEYYIWIVIVGGVFMFLAAMGIGANDVANAFATSVGSKALTMRSAVIIATIFELAGALFMGSHVTETIRKDIANYECFVDMPAQLMYGCMYVLLSVGIWLFLASKFEMPVSTTHSCVGGMIGMALALGGTDCVNWFTYKDTFPYVGGVGGIILSWLFSPILSLLLALLIYVITRQIILRSDNSFNRSFTSFPIYVGLTLTLNSFFIIYKGGKGIGTDDIEVWVAVLISFGIGIVSSLLVIPVLPFMKKYVLKKFKSDNDNNEIEMTEIENSEIDVVENNISAIPIDENNNKNYTLDYDKEIDIQNDKIVNEIHNNAEKFDPKTEESFKFLQIFTAICDSFSHGANDIANSVGPFAAIYSIWLSGQVSEDSVLGDNSYWILGIGGVGISVGLLAYGYKIIRAIGVKMCKITPSRGFSIELGSATIIIIGSRLGIPLSTTHCQVGATMGIGLLEKSSQQERKCCSEQCAGLNLKIVIKTVVGWVITLLIVGGTSALFVAQGVYSPSVNILNATVNEYVNGTLVYV